MYVFACVILFLCFSVFLVLRISRLGKRECFLYVCSICACLDLSVSSSSWSLGRAAVCDCGTPWTFLLPFFLFSLYIYIENFKNLLVRNHWTDFNIILQKYSFGDPLPRLFKPFVFVKKHGRQGAGLIFPIYLYRKL